MANCANITRRSIFKLAPAAVLAVGGAVSIVSPLSFALAPAQAESLDAEVMRMFRLLSDGQKRNVLEFLRRAHAASTENSTKRNQ